MKKIKIGDKVKVILGADKGQIGVVKTLFQKKKKTYDRRYKHKNKTCETYKKR